MFATKYFTKHQIFAYTDDDVIFQNYTITELKRKIQDINMWCIQNKMNLNKKKCSIYRYIKT